MDCIFRKELAYGLVPFETLYFEGNKCHYVDEHFKRHKRAARILSIDFKLTYEDYNYEIEKYLNIRNKGKGVLKIAILDNKLNFEIRDANYKGQQYLNGLRLCLTRTKRDEANILNYIKTFNYGTNYMEDIRAKSKGYDTALFLNTKSQIAETCYANIFFRNKNTIYTPSITSGILNGIIRKKVIEFSQKTGYEVKCCVITSDEMPYFEECFITNSVAGVFPVKSIENITYYSREFCEKIKTEKYLIRDWNKI
ncbi:aminotransferase IV [Fervidicella metallireducens AeB]|uniref:Aminotransferase IV n=1 Tax=Fervidicella metallireducens AeB TaxID=1403537 RepID=A0A017RW01_9CLOT|nr:aminotransferase class IV [Fervidicella metallireducens]EYE88544.1 aminotransferase IV [Fervidicella metallireducens AeB]